MFLRFQLYYYSNKDIKEKVETMLMIDTRMKISSCVKDFSDDFDESDEDPLEKAIQSK